MLPLIRFFWLPNGGIEYVRGGILLHIRGVGWNPLAGTTTPVNTQLIVVLMPQGLGRKAQFPDIVFTTQKSIVLGILPVIFLA